MIDGFSMVGPDWVKTPTQLPHQIDSVSGRRPVQPHVCVSVCANARVCVCVCEMKGVVAKATAVRHRSLLLTKVTCWWKGGGGGGSALHQPLIGADGFVGGD